MSATWYWLRENPDKSLGCRPKWKTCQNVQPQKKSWDTHMCVTCSSDQLELISLRVQQNHQASQARSVNQSVMLNKLSYS